MKHKMSMRILALTLTWMLCLSAISSTLVSRAIAEGDWDEEEELYLEEEFVMLDDDGNEIPVDAWDTDGGESNGAEETQEHTPRDEFIDRIVALGQKLYEGAGGKAQRAHYAGDIYVCKNFTVYLFRKTRDDFRMAEYPDVSLVIPDNLPAKDCKPYAYGILWKDIAASKGNPFEMEETFRYDTALSKDENMEKAMDFMRKVQRGDYFQMSADYEYGVGAHSAIMLGYDAREDTIHWMDSNMRGKKVNGIRYGIVQFDEVKSVEWWASTFCKSKRGATLYRLREDIVFAPGAAQ